MEEFKVSETMKVLFSEEKEIDYVVLKINGKTFKRDNG